MGSGVHFSQGSSFSIPEDDRLEEVGHKEKGTSLLTGRGKRITWSKETSQIQIPPESGTWTPNAHGFPPQVQLEDLNAATLSEEVRTFPQVLSQAPEFCQHLPAPLSSCAARDHSTVRTLSRRAHTQETPLKRLTIPTTALPAVSTCMDGSHSVGHLSLPPTQVHAMTRLQHSCQHKRGVSPLPPHLYLLPTEDQQWVTIKTELLSQHPCILADPATGVLTPQPCKHRRGYLTRRTPHPPASEPLHLPLQECAPFLFTQITSTHSWNLSQPVAAFLDHIKDPYATFSQHQTHQS